MAIAMVQNFHFCIYVLVWFNLRKWTCRQTMLTSTIITNKVTSFINKEQTNKNLALMKHIFMTWKKIELSWLKIKMSTSLLMNQNFFPLNNYNIATIPKNYVSINQASNSQIHKNCHNEFEPCLLWQPHL